MTKKSVNYRFDENDKKLIELLAKHFGISETDVVRMLVKKAAEEEGITCPVTTVEWQVLDGVLGKYVLESSLVKELEDLKKEVPPKKETSQCQGH